MVPENHGTLELNRIISVWLWDADDDVLGENQCSKFECRCAGILLKSEPRLNCQKNGKR
jgi:hypothetical protein